MASEASKNLERARRSLEKNKLREAVVAYQAVLDEVPSHQESLQALADIYSRLNEPARAAQYYAIQFDRLLETGDLAKASAIFSRFLKPTPQPPDRLMRYAALLQKHNRTAEAMDQYSSAADLFLQQQREIEAVACYESLTVLDPENAARHIALAQLAEKLGHSDMAARAYLRAGQLTLASAKLDEALDYFARAHKLLPADRTGALLFAEARLRKGDAAGAAALLEPLAPGEEKDAAFLALYGESLLRSGQLDRAREMLEAYYKVRPESFSKIFDLISAFLKAGQDAKAAALLRQTRDWMRTARKEIELPSFMDKLASSFPVSLPLAEAIAKIYEELNRETQYFDALVRLFDLYMVAGNMRQACDVLDRLVEIDPYDYRNQDRIAQLEGKVDSSFLSNIQSRAAKAATVSTRSQGFAGAGGEVTSAAEPVSEEARAQHALEDLIVQVEIFLQYSLQSKAVERLTRIAELFPGEEEKNERLRSLYERANWWPKGAPPKAVKPAAPVPAIPAMNESAAPHVTGPVETHRDLAAIAEINRLMYRQSTPREVLAATAAEIGKHLRVTRCLLAVGSAGEKTQLTAEYSTPGVAPAGAAHIESIAELLSKTPPDALGGIELNSSSGIAELNLESALGVLLTDKETQLPAGALVVGDASPRKWKPNESFFLQAVGDQLVLTVNHTRLRSLVRSLAVADERTGLLNRGAYIDCLLAESNRARTQHTPLSLIILQIDRGLELLRDSGDAAVDQYVEQLARTLSSAIRQTDIAVKYTAWSLVFILPDTSLESARTLADKLRQLAGTVRPSWGGQDLSVSAVVAEATARPADETEDRVTEWINRAENGLDEVRQRGGNALVSLATP